MSSSVVYPSTFSSKNITVSEPRVLQSGAKQAYLNYGGERLVMQTAINMSIPFGLNVADKFGPPEYSVELSFRGHQQKPEIQEFMNVISQIDDRLLEEGVKNSRKWFKSDLTRDVIKAFYTPSLKYSKDKDGNQLDYPPNLKLKLRKINNDFETKFYDVNGNPYKGIPIEDLLVKGTQITAIIECAGVWFAGSKFGLTWRAKQIAIHKMPEKIADFAFKGLAMGPSAGSGTANGSSSADDDESDHEDNQASNEIDDDEAFSAPVTKPSAVAAVMPAKKVAPAPEPAPAPTPTQEPVDDDAADDVEPVPAPKKTTVVKKKVVTKK
jgi:Family of unknown function (DUF5871)